MQPSILHIKDQLWKCSTEPKIKTFMWKAVSGGIPIADKMIDRGLKIDSRCQSCGMEGESANHVLFTCSVARQVWALYGYPNPLNEFDSESLYQNLNYLILVSKDSKVQVEIRKAFPWILWQLWKNRNLFSIEGKRFRAPVTITKIRENVQEWFHAQSLKERETEAASHNLTQVKNGAAWVLRNETGEVLLHSRKSFAMIHSKMDACLQSWLWSIESMISHNLGKIIFASEDLELVGALQRPKAWPFFLFYSRSLEAALGNVLECKVFLEDRNSNLGAHLIAKSVTREDRRQSYVATGFPCWLQKIFVDDIARIVG
ncbi:PREDICTED: uncharacterized protein LOC109129907 [Camelina sativa]|uniref:Uncharacterized protein LOC109129907 n=1 Tax=Camelina sativa TaxID=90675 RepID=A0ABM1R646_CAMSA|nr:PREDICTED: uncharacterized protein LOC109129907 [Camelina sativa]